MTPKAYAAETRARRAAESLRTAGTVTEAIYDAGFNALEPVLREGGGAARHDADCGAAGRGGRVIRFAVGEASLGAVLVAATDKGVAAILLGDDPEALVRTFRTVFRAPS